MHDSEAFCSGDVICITTLDSNKFKRFWHFVTFRKPPVITSKMVVCEVTDGDTLTVEDYNNGNQS
jgi:hypothetical protein